VVDGVRQGRPAIASTLDGGRTWSTPTLPETVSNAMTVRVSTLGTRAHAVALRQDPAVAAVPYSSDVGRTFTITAEPAVAQLDSLTGELLPLLDRRLLATSRGHWYLSSDHGATFHQAEGTLPVVGALELPPLVRRLPNQV
jgi:hypothetical protein